MCRMNLTSLLWSWFRIRAKGSPFRIFRLHFRQTRFLASLGWNTVAILLPHFGFLAVRTVADAVLDVALPLAFFDVPIVLFWADFRFLKLFEDS